MKIINPGEFKDKISMLELVQEGNNYVWTVATSIWGKAEQSVTKNLFSRVGKAEQSVTFTIRKKSNLTLHHAFRWRGKHCFLTDIIDVDRMYFTVAAALIEPKTCSIKRTVKPTLNELNRPIYAEPTIITFPGCLTEKYLGHTQGEPMATSQITYVVVTPKVIELIVGEIVTIDGIAYTVMVPHMLDEFKNEYEIEVKEDA